ncbi:acetyltransferase (GNAT) family protein [Sphingobacterium allocomposti]|uniref:Acetyltransferase (GNAT) family protein n=1 Tax=Sphingobacterium allocomposti TaxID=415956 RepID=A0A5S5CZD6_9SPHI|nr:GNAT family N-acetyltransferase [Sphingobacterium composti Yoo et al. 2007 non Ten et al. 2007]TYP87739.1 acetyltransferase (GNAT) family protein [Sphingobacterium composti Yoo et al. 2007 non Ten et al. 2007]
MNIKLSTRRNLTLNNILPLYRANEWSAADKPDVLLSALTNSHSLITAWDGDNLVGLGNAISDGHLGVYYPHLLVHPSYQGRGIGYMIMNKMQEIYGGFHMQMLTADGKAIAFYKKIGFERAGQTEPMWIYSGGEH